MINRKESKKENRVLSTISYYDPKKVGPSMISERNRSLGLKRVPHSKFEIRHNSKRKDLAHSSSKMMDI